MSFPETVQHDARLRAHGICECERENCPHYGRCRVRGKEFHHKKAPGAGGSDELSNCVFICAPCHERVHDTSGLGRI